MIACFASFFKKAVYCNRLLNLSMPLFFPKTQSFGIELSTLSVKAAQAIKRKDKLILSGIGQSSIPEGIIQKGVVAEEGEEDLARIIKKTISNVEGKEIKTKYAVCSLPEESAFIKLIQISKTEENEIREAVKWQIESNFPVELSDVYFDWEIITPDENFQENKIKNKTREGGELLNVSVAVMPKRIVDSHLSVFKKANVQPIVFETESMGIARSLIPKFFSRHPVIMVDIGKCGTGLTVFSGRTILFTSHIDICGQDFDKIISKKLKISLAEAEKLKKETGFVKIDKNNQNFKKESLPDSEWKVYHVPVLEEKKAQRARPKKELVAGVDLIKAAKTEQVFSALSPILTELTEQIHHYIDYFKDFKKIECVPEGAVEKIMLCGGESRLVGLADFISSSLKMPVEIGNPLINISSFKNIFSGNEKRQALPYATVIGLAIRGAE